VLFRDYADIQMTSLTGPLPCCCSSPLPPPQALRNVAAVLKPGVGRVLFRDYADGDLAQTRLQDSSAVKHIRGNFYVRGDGTCCYYFGQVRGTSLSVRVVFTVGVLGAGVCVGDNLPMMT
jgi:hypothetical protein